MPSASNSGQSQLSTAQPGSAIATAAASSREWVSESRTSTPASAAARVEADGGRLAGHDLDLTQAERAREAKRLHDRLLRGEAGRQVTAGPRPLAGIAQLRLGEDAVGQAGMAAQRPLEPLDLEQVDADPTGHRATSPSDRR
jgi:hypothetical protein